MRLSALILTLVLSLFSSQQADQPLVIIVRDGAGNPLQDVSLELLRTGPPHEPYRNCVTDREGACHLLLPPGAYLVQFVGSWQGVEFMPVAGQNSGGLDDGGLAGSGFGLYLEPGEAEQVVTFIIGQRDGQLIPLWDMSRDPALAPQPFAVPDNPFASDADPLAGIDLAPLSALPVEEPTAEPEGDLTQVIESQIGVGDVPTPTVEVATSQAVPASGAASGENAALGLLGIAVLAAFVAVVLLVLRRLRRHR
jgi:hypothetical protein